MKKRWAIKLALCLFAGAVVTWAVAWGCAIWAGSLQGEVQCYHNPRADPVVFEAGTQIGVMRVTGMGRPGTFRDRYPELVADYPGRVWWPSEAVTFNTTTKSYATAAGWPSLAVFTWRTGRIEVLDGDEGIEVHDEHHWGIPLRDRRPNDFVALVLPLRPLWRGFALNTLLYGGVLLGLVEAVRFARRRARRNKGRCPACGYDRGGLAKGAVCPECGAVG